MSCNQKFEIVGYKAKVDVRVIYDLAHSCVTARKNVTHKVLDSLWTENSQGTPGYKISFQLSDTLPPKGAFEFVWDALIHNLILNDGA